MKKLFFASLWVLACLTAACSDEKDEPNGESGSVVGEWVFQKNEYYRNGKMIDSFTAVEDEDKMIAVIIAKFICTDCKIQMCIFS